MTGRHGFIRLRNTANRGRLGLGVRHGLLTQLLQPRGQEVLGGAFPGGVGGPRRLRRGGNRVRAVRVHAEPAAVLLGRVRLPPQPGGPPRRM